MIRRGVFLFLAALLVAPISARAETAAPPAKNYNPIDGQASGPDLNLSFGWMRGIDTPSFGERVSSFDFRAQTGLMLVRGSWFYGLGPFVDYATNFSTEGDNLSFGALAYYSDAQAGGWFELGALRSNSPSLGFLAGGGMGIFGIEFQTRKRFTDDASRDWFATFKVRVPVSAIVFLIRN